MKSTDPLPHEVAAASVLFGEMTPAALAARGGSLGVGRGFRPSGPASASVRPPAPGLLSRLSQVGWVELPALSPSACRDLLSATAELRRAGLPLTALYVFDEVWEIGARLAEMLGPGYGIAPDAWAFWVPPGQAGWPPHRGVYQSLDRDAPAWLNAWVALDDVEADRASIHLVPLPDDPAYARGELDDVAVPDGKARALPVSAGTALVWNANVLHWGGPCAEAAKGPRVSITFTLVREGAGEVVDLAELGRDPWKRLDLVAAQILTYGDRDPAITPAAKAWAAITSALRSRGGQRRPEGTPG